MKFSLVQWLWWVWGLFIVAWEYCWDCAQWDAASWEGGGFCHLTLHSKQRLGQRSSPYLSSKIWPRSHSGHNRFAFIYNLVGDLPELSLFNFGLDHLYIATLCIFENFLAAIVSSWECNKSLPLHAIDIEEVIIVCYSCSAFEMNQGSCLFFVGNFFWKDILNAWSMCEREASPR